ncbi:GEVED domain-containing protein [Pedococcus sp. P5_B7]
MRIGTFKQRVRVGAVGAAMAAVALGVAVSAPAQAVEVPTAAAVVSGGTGTLTMPGSGLTASVTSTGLTQVTNDVTLGSRGYVAGDYSAGLTSTTPGVEVITDAVNSCPAVGTCSGLGTITITFSQPVRNPILNVAGIGGDVFTHDGSSALSQSQLHDVLTLTTAGVMMTDLSGGNLAVSGNTITADNHSTSYKCNTTAQVTGAVDEYDAQDTAACGSVRLNGLVTSVTFTVSAVFTRTTSAVPAYTNNDLSDPEHNADGFVMTFTVPEDFGDAPSSYDEGNAARAVLSDVRLGSGVSEDNATVANGSVSPNAGASANGDQADDGVVLGPLTVGNTAYSTTVALSGASKAGTVCGWIDFNHNGTFDNPAERACAAFAAGATSANLTWSGITGLEAGNTYARFRVGYDAAATQSPIGASDAGEVEDYLFEVLPSQPIPVADPRVLLAMVPLGALGVVALRRSRRQHGAAA